MCKIEQTSVNKGISPLVRTNPVTGWKTLMGVGQQVLAGWIDGVTPHESDILKAYCESNSEMVGVAS